VLVEGNWETGVGLPATECRDALLRHRSDATVHRVGDDAALWGRPVGVERYVVVSSR
jgi:hypothetical protein